MAEPDSMEMIRRVLADHQHVPVLVTYWDILMIFEAATMTITHPNLTAYTKQYYTELAQQLEPRLAEAFPELKPLLKMAWNRQLNLTDDPVIMANREEWMNKMSARYRRKTGRK